MSHHKVGSLAKQTRRDCEVAKLLFRYYIYLRSSHLFTGVLCALWQLSWSGLTRLPGHGGDSEMVMVTSCGPGLGDTRGVAGVTEMRAVEGRCWAEVLEGRLGVGVRAASSWMTGMTLLLCRTALSPHRSSSTEVTSCDSRTSGLGWGPDRYIECSLQRGGG